MSSIELPAAAPAASPARPATVATRPPRAAKKTAGKPKRRTQAERSDSTRQRVIEAAAMVLRRKGYAGLRTEEVSRVAKVSRGAQQYHFRTKDSLVLATASYLLNEGLDRSLKRAQGAGRGERDPIDAVIEDAQDFFMGPDFHVILDLVLASTKTRGLRDKVYGYTRESRLGVEAAWCDALVARGIPPKTADSVIWLTISIIRGFSVRALWQRDEARFRELLDEWKLILAGHLQGVTKA